MRNFLRIANDVDALPILAALKAHPDLWNEHRVRTTYPESPHHQVDDILVMFENLDGDVVNDVQTHPYRAWNLLPIRDLVLNLMRRVNGTQLGRVIITRLAPGKSIAAHADAGAPAEFYTRFQVALQSNPGCNFECGEEVIQFAAGEVWQFDNREVHSVMNNSGDDRIAMVVDIRIC